jgi:FtsP/CotA-like multicopper oxidase with cupredoxin domain
MFHCHNLDHANLGLVMHLVYQGVYDPYMIGGPTDNNPD